MAEIHIALIEPQIPGNTGNIARTCAAAGATLHLIRPLGFDTSEKQVRRAGLDYWDKLNVLYHEGFYSFAKEMDMPLFFLSTKAYKIYSDVAYPPRVCFVFGREDRGINEKILLENEQTCVTIPMKEDSRSLNLSNAAAIMTYEFLRQQNFSGLPENGKLHAGEWNFK